MGYKLVKGGLDNVHLNELRTNLYYVRGVC